MNGGFGGGNSILSIPRHQMSGEIKDFANIVDDLGANLESIDPQGARSEALFSPKWCGEIVQR